MKVNLTIGIPSWLDRLCAWPVTAYRKHKYGYAYRRIYLGEGKFAIVDPGNYFGLNKYNWCLCDNGLQRYARRAFYDPKVGIKTESMHREIMKPASGRVIDHRNGDGLDNRRDNLRPATHSQNCFNRRKTKSKTSSRFVGVHFHENRWRAYIKYSGKRIWLGRFINEIDAARAYDRAAIKYHGEFARLNFPE